MTVPEIEKLVAKVLNLTDAANTEGAGAVREFVTVVLMIQIPACC
jgi:hypothetical protein